MTNTTRNLTAVMAAGVMGVVLQSTALIAVAQNPKVESSQPDKNKLAQGWNEKDKHPTLFPDLEPGKDFKLEDAVKKLPEVVVYDSDPPLRRAAKKKLLVELEALRLINLKIQAGAFISSGSPFTQLATLGASIAESAQMIEADADTVQRYFEFQVLVVKTAEQFLEQRVKAGVETELSTLPVLTAQRYAAEIELLKRKENTKKPGAPPVSARPCSSLVEPAQSDWTHGNGTRPDERVVSHRSRAVIPLESPRYLFGRGFLTGFGSHRPFPAR